MFPAGYFSGRYFPGRFWPKGEQMTTLGEEPAGAGSLRARWSGRSLPRRAAVGSLPYRGAATTSPER